MVTPGQLARRAQLYDQLAASITAGLPLMQALEMAGRNRSLRGSQLQIRALLGHLRDGYTFADSMRKVSGWLPEFDIALLTAGEQSGRIDTAFKELGRSYAATSAIVRQTIKSLLTVLVTLHVFLLVFPLPLLVNFAWGIIDGDYSRCVPFLFWKAITFGILYGVVFFFIFACQGNRHERWRAIVENFFNCVPMLRTALKELAVARFTSALDALLNAGVPVIKSWELAAAASGSPRLRRELEPWLPELETGMTPADIAAQIRWFPEMFTNLYTTAELSGQHDETLKRLNVYFEEEGRNNLQYFIKIAIGITIGVIMAIIAYNIIKFWVGYYGAMIQNLQ
jgi:type II secretory pathway component PulF